MSFPAIHRVVTGHDAAGDQGRRQNTGCYGGQGCGPVRGIIS